MLIPTTFKKVPNQWLHTEGRKSFFRVVAGKKAATIVAN
jgi:hypothetical protein